MGPTGFDSGTVC